MVKVPGESPLGCARERAYVSDDNDAKLNYSRLIMYTLTT